MEDGIRIGRTLLVKKEDEKNDDGGNDFTWYVASTKFKKKADYKDWKLPTKEQLNTMYVSKKGDFKESYYWSDDENENVHDQAWYQNFANGGKMYNFKSLPARVRLVKVVEPEKPKESSAHIHKLIGINGEINVQGWNDWRKNNMDIKPNLRRENLDGKDLTGVNFSNTDLQYASLKGTNLTNANLSKAIVNGADFKDTILTNTNTDSVKFDWALNHANSK